MIVEAKRFRSLDEFWEINAEAERDWPYTGVWIDCLAKAGAACSWPRARAARSATASPCGAKSVASRSIRRSR